MLIFQINDLRKQIPKFIVLKEERKYMKEKVVLEKDMQASHSADRPLDRNSILLRTVLQAAISSQWVMTCEIMPIYPP